MKLVAGQRVRVVRDVDTFFVDPRYMYAGMDYDEYANLHEPHRLLAGSVGSFDTYLAATILVGVITECSEPTPLCNVMLGRTRCWVARIPSDAVEPCDPETPLTALPACVDRALLPPGHIFWEDPLPG